MSRARVLCVDDDQDIAEFISHALSHDDLHVESASTPKEALSRLQEATYDLLLLDVNLPGMTGLQLRDRVRSERGDKAPKVLFLSGADAEVEGQIARQLGNDRLLLKPLPAAELRRAVFAALGLVRQSGGPLPESLDRLLYEIAENREAGVFTAVRGSTLKRVVMQDGHIVFATSNDPKDLIGQAMVRAGLITEAELGEAFGLAATAAPPKLASALTALRKVTPEQCQKIFESKIREAVLELFLWSEGRAEFVAGGVESSDMPFPLSLQIQAIRTEGMKRRRRWIDVRRVLPDFSARFERVAPWPDGFPVTPGDKLVAQLLESQSSIERLMLELRGQEYAIALRVAELVTKGVLKRSAARGAVPGAPVGMPVDAVSEVPSGEFPQARSASMPSPEATAKAAPVESHPAEPADPAVAEHLLAAVALLRDGRPQEAYSHLQAAIALDPLNAFTRDRLREAEQAIVKEARDAGLRDETSLRLAIPVSALLGRSLKSSEAFILSRFAAGPITVGTLLHVCPLPAHEILTTLRKLLTEGLVK